MHRAPSLIGAAVAMLVGIAACRPCRNCEVPLIGGYRLASVDSVIVIADATGKVLAGGTVFANGEEEESIDKIGWHDQHIFACVTTAPSGRKRWIVLNVLTGRDSEYYSEEAFESGCAAAGIGIPEWQDPRRLLDWLRPDP